MAGRNHAAVRQRDVVKQRLFLCHFVAPPVPAARGAGLAFCFLSACKQGEKRILRGGFPVFFLAVRRFRRAAVRAYAQMPRLKVLHIVQHAVTAPYKLADAAVRVSVIADAHRDKVLGRLAFAKGAACGGFVLGFLRDVRAVHASDCFFRLSQLQENMIHLVDVVRTRLRDHILHMPVGQHHTAVRIVRLRRVVPFRLPVASAL